MKKRFFQKLSFVLALAMVLSVVSPASSALASKGPSLNSVKKYLHLGREDANEYNFNIKDKKSGWKYNWESANEKVATVNERNGVTTAQGVGKTEVSVYITNKDGIEVTTLIAEVIVRDNIEEVTINNPIETLAVGERHNFNRDFVTEAGRTDKTSAVTRWIIESADGKDGGVELNENNGVVTALEAGVYTITALSFQSKARYNNWLKDSVKYAGEVLDTDTCTFTVGNEMVEAIQVDSNKLKVVFSSDVDEEIAGKLEVSRQIGETGTKIKEVIKSAKVDETDAKVVNIELYVGFSTDTTYVVDYPEMDSVYFKSATVKAEDVANLEIVTEKVIEGKATEIKVKLYNENGVDITTEDLLGYVTISSESDKAWFNTTNNELTIFVKGDTAKITATYHTYKYDPNTGNEVGALVRERIVYAVEEAVVAVGSLASWTIVKDAASADFDKPNQTIAAEDDGMKLFVRTTLTNSDKFEDNKELGSKFTFESSDPTTLIVTPDGHLYPVKAGPAVVVVKYDGNVIGAINIAVGAKRVATNLKLDKNAITLSNSGDVADVATVKIELKDQYGVDVKIDPSNSEIKLNNSNLTVGTLTAPGQIGTNELTFNGSGVPANTYSFSVKVNGKTTILVVNVQEPKDSETAFYRLKLDTTSFDTALSSDKKNVNAEFNVVGYASNNVANEIIAVSGSAATGKAFSVEVSKDGKSVDYTVDASGKNIAVRLAELITDENAYKAAAGTYKVELKETLDSGAIRVHHIVYFDVKDTQASPALTIDKVVSGETGLKAALADCLTIKLDGTELSVTDYDVIGDPLVSKTVYVKTVTVRQDVGGAYIDHKVNVNRTISYK